MVTPRNTREDVIVAAGRLFAARGYHGTSMRDLGRELGLHGSSLYSHVTSKEDLLVAVVERGAERFEHSAEQALSGNGTPIEQLRALVGSHVDVVLDHTDEAKTFLDEARSLDDPARRRIRDARNAYEQRFRAVIADGVNSGAFAPDTDPKIATIFVLSILNAVERWYDSTGPLDRRALVDEIWRFVSTALSNR
jgi:AcrR family transcriptional regulator